MPTQVAEIIDKGPGDHILILNTRCQLVYPFDAPGWQDLRVAFLLSVCPTGADDPVSPITGLAENLLVSGVNTPDNQLYIGIKTNNDSLPSAGNVGFIGYSTNTASDRFSCELVSSDGAIGTGTNYWRPRVSAALGGHNDLFSAIILDEGSPVTPAFNGSQPHFPQLYDGTHGYATLLMLRIVRRGGALDVSIKYDATNSGDVLFSSVPDSQQNDLLETNMANYPAAVQTKIANRMAHIPDALYLYWPFHQSRLRIHSLGFMKFR